MACSLTQGFLKDCRESVGGTIEFYFANKPASFSTTIGASGISSYTASPNPTWYKYVPRKATSSFTTTAQTNEQNGTVFYESTIQIVLSKMEQNKQNEIKLLARADLLIIVKDQNGKYWLFGEQNGCILESSPAGSGTAYGDRNGYELNFMASEPNPTNEILYAAFSSHLG